MPNNQEQQNVQAQIFDFIFASQNNPPTRKPPATGDDFVDIMLDLGTQPALYPINEGMKALSESITAPAVIEEEGGLLKFGPGMELFTNTSDAIRTQVKKNQAKRNWRMLAGGIKKSIDGPLASILAVKEGVDAKTAMKIGRLISGIEDLNSMADRGLDRNAQYKEIMKYIDNMESSISKELAEVYENVNDENRLKSFMRSQQKISQKEDRIANTVEYFTNLGLSRQEASKISKDLWGEAGERKNFGIYYGLDENDNIQKRGNLSDNLNNSSKVLMKYSYERGKINRMQNLQNEIEGLNREAEDMRSQMEDLDYRLQGVRDENEAQRIIGEVQRLQNEMSRLQNRINSKSNDLTSIARRTINMNEVNSLLRMSEENGGIPVKGIRGISNSIVNAASIISWINRGGIGDNILTGEWEKIGIMDSKGLARQFSVIVEDDKDLARLGYGKVQASANTVMGQLIGHLYYLHPINFMKGMISGDIWLKLGKKDILKKGNKSFFAFLHSISPQQWLKNNKIFQGVKGAFQKILPNSLAIKTFIRNIVTKIIAVNPLTGFIVNFIVNALGDEITVFLTTVLIACIFGVIAVFTAGLNSLPSTQSVAGVESHYMQECNANILSIVANNPFPNNETLCYYLAQDLGEDFLENLNYSSSQSDEIALIREQVDIYENEAFE
jgi:predicted  nucleic acid-binding Zn-ribbon protein